MLQVEEIVPVTEAVELLSVGSHNRDHPILVHFWIEHPDAFARYIPQSSMGNVICESELRAKVCGSWIFLGHVGRLTVVIEQ